MTKEEQCIQNFYTAFQNRDPKSMAACYHPNAKFQDPAFGILNYEQTVAMWHMLVHRAKDLVITFGNVQANESHGKANWQATYTFTNTGRKVINNIQSTFLFKEGTIIDHQDTFDFRNWAKQAFAFPLTLVAGTRFFQKFIKKTVLRGLESYMAKGKQNK